MSDYDFELETLAYFEARAILSGKKKPGPNSDFMKMAHEIQKQFKETGSIPIKGVPVTPEELGWNKDV